jgi:hypothetical protein
MKEYLKFLPSYSKFIELGFTDDDLLKAINELRIDNEDLTTTEEVEFLPIRRPYILVKDNHECWVNRAIRGNRGRTRKERVKVIGYLIEVGMQTIIESELFHSLLSTRFSWFNNNIFTKVVKKTFSTKGSITLKSVPYILKDWTISELLSQKEVTYTDKESRFKTYRPDNEIYLETDTIVNGHFQSIYIPLDALFIYDWNKLLERHTRYHKDYYGKFKPELLEPSLSVLESPEALKLKELWQKM